MPPKRALDVADNEQRPSKDSAASPTKRAKRESFAVPQTPIASTSAAAAIAPWASSSGMRGQRRGSAFATPATPYTPFPLHPSDSPSNPFKRKKNVESLPPISSFSKHIALRFQLHRRGVGFKKGGVHRIVQVPLNYTFTHLRALIAWLFDTPIKCTNGKGGEEEYLFEVKKSIVAESMLMKPGMIKSGTTTVKLSNTRDPWRKRYGRDFDEEDELLDDESGTDVDGDDEDDSSDWVWADEEEYTLGHVWITGVRADRGVIYHLSPNTQIHITANTTKLPRRRGKANVPFVFFARGRVHLSPRPLPRPIFAKSISQILSSSPARLSSSQTTSKGKKKAVARKRASPAKYPPPVYPIEHSPEKAQENTSDADADGDTDEDEDHDPGSVDFDDSHPFFQSLDRESSTSPRKKGRSNVEGSPKVIVIQDSDDEVEEDSPPKRKRVSSPEVIFVEDSDEESNHEGSDDESESDNIVTETFDRLIDPQHWNAVHYAFGRYLLSFLDPRGRKFTHVEDEFFEDKKVYDPFENDDTDDEEGNNAGRAQDDEEYVEEDSMHQEVVEDQDEEDEDPTKKATPALTNASASSHNSSSLPPSSPFVRGLISSSPAAWQLFPDSDASFASTTSHVDPLSLSPSSSLKHHPAIIATHYPNKKYSFTPAPPKARKHRVRLERVERRFEKGKKGSYLCAADEQEEEVKGKGEDIDELDDDEEDKENIKWVKPKLKPGEIWDPFGDEPEI